MLTTRFIKEKSIEISISSPEYPAAWREFTDPPITLYAFGDITLLRERKLAVVGSRRTPTNALKLGAEIMKELSQRLVVVTGVADGGDVAAIEGVLQGSGRVICLLAGGFSSLPQANLALLERVIERGLLLSPHPFETPIRSFSYEYRNRLLAKLCEGVFVLGAGEKSGALITAKYAKAYQKPIFALPYPPNSTSGCGCNALIKGGGYLTENSGDIATRLGISLEEKKKETSLSPEEERVFAALKDCIEAHAGDLAKRAGIPAFKMRAICSALEVKGLIVAVGGNRYAIV